MGVTLYWTLPTRFPANPVTKPKKLTQQTTVETKLQHVRAMGQLPGTNYCILQHWESGFKTGWREQQSEYLSPTLLARKNNRDWEAVWRIRGHTMCHGRNTWSNLSKIDEGKKRSSNQIFTLSGRARLSSWRVYDLSITQVCDANQHFWAKSTGWKRDNTQCLHGQFNISLLFWSGFYIRFKKLRCM